MPHFGVQVMRQWHALSAESPLVIANGTCDRGTVVDLSPDAHAHGVRIGMLVWAARRQCRGLRVVADDADATAAAMKLVDEVLHRHSHAVTTDRPGRWTFPLAALGNAYGRAAAIAEALVDEVRHATGYQGRIGLAAHIGIAKIAATHAANRGDAVVVLPGTEAAFLAPLALTTLPGIGAKTAAALARLGVTTIGQLADVPAGVLTQVCGARAAQLIRAARGLPPSERERSDTITASWSSHIEPVLDPHVLHAACYALTEQIGRHLRDRGTAAGTLAVEVTWTDGVRRREAISWTHRCDLDRSLTAASSMVLDRLLAERRLGMVGMTVVASDLGARQHDLLAEDDSRIRDIQTALDTIKRRFGAEAILPARIVSLRSAATRAAA